MRPAMFLFAFVVATLGCSQTGRAPFAAVPPAPDQTFTFSADNQDRLQRDLLDARREIVQLEQELKGRDEILALSEQRIDNFRDENTRLQSELAGIVMNSAGTRPSTPAITPVSAATFVGFDVPQAIEESLTQFARKYEGLEFQKVERLCRFQSELAFLDGGDLLRPEARAALKELADILNLPAARAFNIQIVGHTGSGLIPTELASQHPTPWHLASHQAIAVEQFLEEQGINGVRMGTVSYADQQPMVEGDDDVARRRNGRIEIYILPPDPPVQ